jgi:hypothetical protein
LTSADLCIWQTDNILFEINVLPLQTKYFTEPHSGQGEKSSGVNRFERLRLIVLHLLEPSTNYAQIVIRRETLTSEFSKRLNATCWVILPKFPLASC